MSVLSNNSIKRACLDDDIRLIDPFSEDLLQPASYDVCLGESLLVDVGGKHEREYRLTAEDPYEMRPKEFLLAHTIEYIRLPAVLCGKFEGKSSLGRQGLMTHVTAGFIDPGFEGTLTLELYNVSNTSLYLRKGMRVGQLAFNHMDSLPTIVYGERNHYQGQTGVQKASANILYGSQQ